MLLGGDGVHLTSSGWQHTLAERWQPFAFSGDEVGDCTMLGGISTDFNLMLRRGVWEGALQVVREPPPTGAGVVHGLQGRWQTVQAGQAARVLTVGQGAWWLDAASPRLQPVRDPAAPSPCWHSWHWSGWHPENMNEIGLWRLSVKRWQLSIV